MDPRMEDQLAWLDLRDIATSLNGQPSSVSKTPSPLSLPNEIWLRTVEVLEAQYKSQQDEGEQVDSEVTFQMLKSLSRTSRALRDFAQSVLFNHVKFEGCFDSRQNIKFDVISQPQIACHIRTLELSAAFTCKKAAGIHLPFTCPSEALHLKVNRRAKIVQEYLETTATERVKLLLTLCSGTLRELRVHMRDQHIDNRDYIRRTEVEQWLFRAVFDCLQSLDFPMLKRVCFIAPSKPKSFYEVCKEMNVPGRYNKNPLTVFESNIRRIKYMTIEVRFGFEGIAGLAKTIGQTTDNFELVLGYSRWKPPSTIPAHPAIFKTVDAVDSFANVTRLELDRLEVIGSLSELLPSFERVHILILDELQLIPSQDDWCTLISTILSLKESKEHTLDIVKIRKCGYKQDSLFHCERWYQKSLLISNRVKNGGTPEEGDNEVRALCTCRADDIDMFQRFMDEETRRRKEMGRPRGYNDPLPTVCVHDESEGIEVGGSLN